MRFLIAGMLLLSTAGISAFFAPPDAPPSSTYPATASQVATTSAPGRPIPADAEIERLIRELGDPSFEKRESAQRALAARGDAAVPHIAAHLDHGNPEIAHRLIRLLQRPADPALRIDTVRRLIASANPDWIEMGVYMLFRDPVADADAFRQLAEQSSGIEGAMFAPIAEQLDEWKRITELHLRRQKTLITQKPDAAEKERKMHAETFYYQAEAAYWQALEAAAAFRSRPATSSETATTMPQTATQPHTPSD